MKKNNTSTYTLIMFLMVLIFSAGFLIGRDTGRSEFVFKLHKTSGGGLTEINMGDLKQMPLTFCGIPQPGTSDTLPDGSRVNFAGGLALEVVNTANGVAWRFCTGIPSGTTPAPAQPGPKQGI
jgi:hypothetical protein